MHIFLPKYYFATPLPIKVRNLQRKYISGSWLVRVICFLEFSCLQKSLVWHLRHLAFHGSIRPQHSLGPSHFHVLITSTINLDILFIFQIQFTTFPRWVSLQVGNNRSNNLLLHYRVLGRVHTQRRTVLTLCLYLLKLNSRHWWKGIVLVIQLL